MGWRYLFKHVFNTSWEVYCFELMFEEFFCSSESFSFLYVCSSHNISTAALMPFCEWIKSLIRAEWKTENVLLFSGCTQQTVALVFVHWVKEFLASKGKCKLWVDPENPDLHALWRVIWCVKLRRGKEPIHGFNVASQVSKMRKISILLQWLPRRGLESAEMRIFRDISSSNPWKIAAAHISVGKATGTRATPT